MTLRYGELKNYLRVEPLVDAPSVLPFWLHCESQEGHFKFMIVVAIWVWDLG